MHQRDGLSISPSLRIACAALFGLLWTTSYTQAAVITWAPDADGFWDVPANWSSNLPDITLQLAGNVVQSGTQVPEPLPVILLGVGLFVVAYIERRRLRRRDKKHL